MMLVKAAGRFFSITYIALLCVFLAASVTPHLHPASWWFVGFTGLLFPYLFLALLIMMFFCVLFKRKRLAIAGLIAILISIPSIGLIFGLNFSGSFRPAKDSTAVRVMSWNVRRFTPYNKDFFDPKNNNLKDIIEEVVKYQPDVLCLQEFYTGPSKKRRNLELFRDSLHYPYVSIESVTTGSSRSQSGTVIFSRYPFVKKYTYQLPENYATAAEDPVAADILVGKDTIRVITFHLQSYGFMNRDYEDLYKIKNQEDQGLRASKNIFRKMQYAFSLRGVQSDIIEREVSRSPYPVIVCGDLNDVPNSYAYETVRGDMRDAFLEEGTGLGKSFISGRSKFLTWLPTLRIDYIFTSPRLQVEQFKMVTRDLSDHRGLITDLKMSEK
ncbi:MAG: endonuclease/exonuclease/phosphatase family protein [Chitinophagaceae bacterium]